MFWRSLPVAALFLTVPAGNARGAPAPSRTPEMYASFGLGLATQSQPGFRQWFESEKVAVGGSVPTNDWKTRFGLAVSPGLELGLRADARWSLSISALSYGGKVENSVNGTSRREWETRIEDHLIEYSILAAYWPAAMPGAYAGARIGRASSRHSINGGGYLDSAATTSTSVSGTWRGSAATYGVYAGWRSEWDVSPLMDVRAGWNWRDFGVIDGDSWQSAAGPEFGPLRDYNGRPVSTDYSGAFVTVALVFTRRVARWAR